LVDVSIIVPCYNREKLVSSAIRSALDGGSGGVTTEVIVIDDGSTDHTWDEISRFAADVRAVRTENQGVSAARNLGIAMANGRYIRFLDSDDRLLTDTLDQHLDAADRASPRKIVVADAASINENGGRIGPCGYGYAHLSAGEISRGDVLRYVMSPFLPMYPTAALRECRGFDTRFHLGEDYDLAMRLLRAGYTFTHEPLVVCEVREHSGARLSRSYTAERYSRQLSFFRHIWSDWRSYAADPLSKDERVKLGQGVWTLARSASREQVQDQARSFFALAREIAGGSPVVAKFPLPLLYTVMDPYSAERTAELLKRLLRGGR